MDFEKEYIPDEQEDFDTDFDTEEITPIKSLRSDPPPQYFTNIDGKYCKDVAGREELDELKALVDDVPWQPLEDGYSNFWFELTNDTLSPWLNFNAKTESAVIDWGDGSGEQALTTLTPTHTYSKAGRYVVKVKGATGIGQQFTPPYTEYINTLKNVELNSEVVSLANSSFSTCLNLKNIIAPNVSSVGSYCFSFCSNMEQCSIPVASTLSASSLNYCFKLKQFVIPQTISILNATTFYYDRYLSSITIPSSINSIGNSCFGYCASLSEVHCQATVPPTLGTNVFQYLPSNFIIYVPVGYGETYKAASGWSTYADHILEEGQTPNRMMLAKFNSTKSEESEVKGDELYQDSNR